MMKKALLSLFTALVCLPTVFAQADAGHALKIDTISSCQNYTWPRNNQMYDRDTVALYTSGDTTYVLNFTKMQSYVDTAEAILVSGECSASWNGMEWTAAGTYLDTLTAVTGCDSVVKVQVKLANTDTLLTLNQCGSYTAPWGTVYTESRVIDTTISNADGCTYHNVINLTVNPAYTDSPVIEVTSGCTYNWDGTMINDMAIHQKSFTTAAGCDSIVRLRVTAFTGEQHDTTTMVACDSYKPAWRSAITTSGLYLHDTAYGTYPDGDTMANCMHHEVLDLTIITSVSDSADVEPQAVTAGCSYTWGGQTYTDTLTHYHLFTSVIGGCDSMAGIQVTYTNINYDTTFAEYCGDAYNWKTSNPTLPLPGQSSQYRFTTDTTTTVTVVDTVSGCTTHYTLVLNFFTKTDTVDQYYCGDSYTYSYKRLNTNTTPSMWQTVNTTFNASGMYTESADGEPLIQTEPGSNCQTFRTLNLTLNVPEQRFRADSIDTVVCERFRFRIDRHYGNWVSLTSSCDEDKVHSERSQSNVNRCYDSIVHVKLTVNKNTFIERTVTECDSYTWSEFDGNTYTTSGTYRDTLDETDANGCLMIGRLNLTINTTPTIDIQGNWCLQPGESTVLKAVPTASSDAIGNYKWYVNETLKSTTDSLTLEDVRTNTDVRLVSTSVKNCVATNWITVTANVGIDDVEALQVNVYPNPASRFLHVESTDAIASVAVFNTVGQQVVLQQPNSERVTLDLSRLASGNYTLRITAADGSQSIRKFIVNK